MKRIKRLRHGVRLLSREDAPRALTEQSAVLVARRFALRDEECAALEAGRARIAAVGVALAVGFVVLVGRAVTVSMDTPPPLAVARAEAERVQRADLVDRNGEILATTLETHSLYADPRQVWDVAETTRALTAVLPELSPATVEQRLSSGRSFIWLARNLTPTQRQAVFSLGLPGLHFTSEPRRVYPRGNLAAHVLGATDVDGNGAAGLELGLNDVILETGARGRPLPLSLDMRVQYALAEILEAGMQEFSAKGASGVVMDVRTGEVVAMVSLPDFDPNRPGEAADEQRLNRATTAQYEMGSTFKTFTVAMGLEEGVATLTSTYDVSRPLTAARGCVTNDFHGLNRVISLQELYEQSSNIGAGMIALEVGADRQRNFLERLGLLSAAPGELPEISRPILPTQWRACETVTISFGHGLSVSQLATVAAYATIANGGNYVKPTFRVVPAGREVETTRVMSANTAADMMRLMRLVVTNGTGGNAEAPGYRVAGKTGTAEKAVAGGYSRTRLLTSFAAIFPFDNPRYAVHIQYDEPQPTPRTYGYRTAGWNAAPTTGAAIARIAPMLGVERREEHQAGVGVGDIARVAFAEDAG